MSELCKWCAYEHSDCKGNKDIPYNMHCQYYKKPAVFNAKEAAQQIQFLRGVLDQVEEDYSKLKAKTEWIPVSERLPEASKQVLIQDNSFCGGELIAVASYDNKFGWRWRDDMSTASKPDPVAWMPLPEPYKGE